jgi:DNA polymerase III epsilon subunit-like protein
MFLFFDTETTGIPRDYKAPVSDLGNWPRLVQIAWLLIDDQQNEISSAEFIVRPEGFDIPAEAARIHGITTEMARRDGVSLHSALDEVTEDILRASVLIAHNMQFDEKILGAELLRAGRQNVVEAMVRRCTMQSATNYCQLPGRYGYKWPTLQELHQRLFGELFEGAHHALVDVRACAKCFFELKRLGVMA